MKDPIKEHSKQGQKLDEIFGWLSRTFGSKSQPAGASTAHWKHDDTDADCSPLGIKMGVGDKLNRKVAGASGTANITIGTNAIKNIKGLRFEVVDGKGKGTGKFVNAVVRDFKCYDEGKDIYGIKWLFDDNCSYEADSITGDLKAGVKNQSVNFTGKWNGGKFYGKFMSGPDNFKGIPAPSATFAFFDSGKTVSTPASKKKTKRKNTKKKTTTPAAGATATPTSPVAVGSVAPSPAASGKTTPMTSRVAVGSIAPASATTPPATPPATPSGPKGRTLKKKITEEITVTGKPITMRDFLDSFM